MSTSNWMNKFRERGLHPFQASFATDVIESDSPELFLLVASPGMGKTNAFCQTISAGMQAEIFKRCLCLTPNRVLAENMTTRMRQLSDTGEAVKYIDRLQLREFEEEADVQSDDVWPTKGVFVTTIELAKRPDVSWMFEKANWDLIVIDDIRQLDGNSLERTFISKFLNARCPRLVITFFDEHSMRQFEADVRKRQSNYVVNKSVWSTAVVSDWEGTPLWKRNAPWQVAPYVFSPSEERLYHSMGNVLTVIHSALGEHGLLGRAIVDRWKSSVFAFERCLASQRDWLQEKGVAFADGNEAKFLSLKESLRILLKNRQIDELASIAPREVGEEHDETVVRYAKAVIAIEVLTSITESVEGDSKSNALIELIKGNAEGTRICITSRFASTISYLDAVLEDALDSVPIVLNSSKSSESIKERLEEYSERGGVLLATDASLTGIDLSNTDVLVHYDIPDTRDALLWRISRFVRFGRKGALNMVSIVEQSAKDELEQIHELSAWLRREHLID